jgi:hypothetical protein
VKVLYALANYPQLSESYIEAEIDFALLSGVAVEVWSPNCKNADVPPQVPVHRGTLIDAVLSFKPDVVHVHYLMFARIYDRALGGNIAPMTVRGHSFDFSTSLAADAVSLPRVKKVYLFPHLARKVPHEKVVALPVAYDAGLHIPCSQKRINLVLRLAAGKKGKGLEELFRIARLCPEMEFVLGVADVIGFETYFHTLGTHNLGLPRPVKLLRDVPLEKAAALTAQAEIYIDTSDPTAHEFGMPISIAEALATGSVVLIRDSMPAREYAGDAAFYYQSAEEAAQIVKMIAAWSPEIRLRQRERAIMQAQFYRADVVLPRLIHDWEEIAAQRR